MAISITIQEHRISVSADALRALFGGAGEGTVRAGLSPDGSTLVLQATAPDDIHGSFISVNSSSFHAPRLVDALIAQGWANDRYYLTTPATTGRVVALRSDPHDPRDSPLRSHRNPDRTAHQKRHQAETTAVASRRDEPWSPEEDARILAFEESARDLALASGRTYDQIRGRRKLLLTWSGEGERKRYWTATEDQILLESSDSARALAEQLGRSRAAVKHRRTELRQRERTQTEAPG